MALYVYLNRDTFNYTGEDQHWTCPETGIYRIECYGAGAGYGKGGYTSGEFTLTQGDNFSVVVGQSGYDANSTSGSYGFGGGKSTESGAPTTSCGGGLSGVFTGDTEVGPNDAERALIIAGGAGGGAGSSGRTGGNGGGLEGGTGGGTKYGTAGGGGTQTGHGDSGNASENQFSGGNGSQKYGYGGGGGRWGGNGAIGDTSGDDDKGAGGGSGYVKSTASNPVLTQGGGALEGDNGKVLITKIS